jgi:hypothetical protein
MSETNKLVTQHGKFLTARDYDVLDNVFSLLDVDKSEELEAPEWALGLFMIFAGEPEKKLKMAFEMIDKDDDGNISQKEIHRFLLPYMNVMVPEGAEVLRPLLAWHCAEECMKDVCNYLKQDKVDEILLEKLVEFSETGYDIVLKAAERVDRKVYNMWLELEHESAFLARKEARKQGGPVRRSMSELPNARFRSRQDSEIFLAAVTDSPNSAVDSCVSTRAFFAPSVSTRPPSEDTSEASSPPRSPSYVQKSSEIQGENNQSGAGALPLPAPPPPAAQLSLPAPPPPAQLALSAAPPAVEPKNTSVVPRLQLASSTAFAVQSHQFRRFSSPQMQMSARVVSSSAPLWTQRSASVMQTRSTDASHVHTVRASPRVLPTVSSHISATSVNPASREMSFQAPSRSMSMQSCHSTMSTPLPHLLGVHRNQPEVKSKLLD